jgi:hypothetical protein
MSGAPYALDPERARNFVGPEFHAIPGVVLGRTMNSWWAMLSRCFNPVDRSFQHYGGRGIVVCEVWFRFDAFFKAMGPRPSGMTIGRLDNDGNYEPGNCAWQTPREQMSNTRRSKRLSVAGVEMVQAEAARLAGVTDATILRRMRRGLTADIAVRSELVKKVKLRAIDVAMIKSLITAEVGDTQIAAHFGVSRQMVGEIRRGTHWGAAR